MAATSSDQDHGSLTERTAGSGDTTRNEHDNMKEEQPLMPVAVVGMSCRLSGNVSTLDEFWEMMSRARCGWSEIPEERFSKNAYHHPNPAKMGAFNTIGGYFLKQDPSMFDAPFFNITQAEAEAMGKFSAQESSNGSLFCFHSFPMQSRFTLLILKRRSTATASPRMRI